MSKLDIVSDNYYILSNSSVIDSSKKTTQENFLWHMVDGAKPINIGGFELFFRYELNSKMQNICYLSDSITGLMISWGWDENDAISKALPFLERLPLYQEEHINKHGLGPRHSTKHKYHVSDKILDGFF